MSARLHRYLRARLTFLALGLGYLLLVVGVVSPRITSQTTRPVSPVEFVAARALVRNHRVEPEDIRVPQGLPGSLHWHLPDEHSLIGHYVKTPCIKTGQPVRVEDVEPWPTLSVSAGHRLRTISLGEAAPLRRLLRPGARVDLCPKSGACPVHGLEVLAIVCEGGLVAVKDGAKPASSQTCSVVVEVPDTDDEAVRKGGGELHLVLVALPG